MTAFFKTLPIYQERMLPYAEATDDSMDKIHATILLVLLNLSVLVFLLPFIVGVVSWLNRRKRESERTVPFNQKLIFFSVFLLFSEWTMRFVAGLYAVWYPLPEAEGLNAFETVFNSFIQTLLTFGVAEDFELYVASVKSATIFASGYVLGELYSAFAILLYCIAPVAGGAILFEILASIFPKIKLFFGNKMAFTEKYYFSELNDASLALARSIAKEPSAPFKKPMLIFTDAYADDDDEKGNELLQGAKALGAVCVKDDLLHVAKSVRGKRTFFLIDAKPIGNLQTLADLSDGRESSCLKDATVYLFSENDLYTRVEGQVRESLLEHGFAEEELPLIVPVLGSRNLVTNLLVDYPLYEPLIGKKAGEDGKKKLKVTVLGSGSVGTETFLSVYWFGQMLDTDLQITVVSKESEPSFRGRINGVNPEILRTAEKDDPILCYDRKGNKNDPYFTFRYICSDVTSDEFLKYVSEEEDEDTLLDTDYFVIALGADEENMALAEKLRRRVGKYHLSAREERHTVIAYVIYDPALAATLNRSCYQYAEKKADVFMRAVGSLDEIYSKENVFMSRRLDDAGRVSASYEIRKAEQKAIDKGLKTRMKDDYKYWASIARVMHLGYKVYSVGYFEKSIFDVQGIDDPLYVKDRLAGYERFRGLARGKEEGGQGLLHRLAYLEHRRWNAFTRVKGFRYSAEYLRYEKSTGSYKHMSLKLHPCLVECDDRGIRAELDEKGVPVQDSLFKEEDAERLDLLDELSYELYGKGLNSYDFKEYDYPCYDV